MRLKITFPLILISTNIVFIFFIIFKQSWLTQLSFEKQKLEKELNELKQKNDELNQELYMQQDPSAIKDFASKQLNLSKIKIAQVKKLQ